MIGLRAGHSRVSKGQNRERAIDKFCRCSTMVSSSYAQVMHPRDHGVGDCVGFFYVFKVVHCHLSTGLGGVIALRFHLRFKPYDCTNLGNPPCSL